MKAAVKNADGLVVADVDVPSLRDADVLVKVRASSLNRADLFLAEGRSHGKHGGSGTVLGLEWAGDVVEVGSAVTAYKAGDRVMCSGIGGLAEYVATDWRLCLPLSAEFSDYAAAACFPVAARTTYVSLSELGKIERGQSVLVLGASSGVGLMCLQVAKRMGAGLVLGTSTKADRRARLEQFGADAALDSGDGRWVEQVLARTQGQGVDLVIDFLAGRHLNEAMRATRVDGCIVNVGRMAGESAVMDFDLHSMRRIRYLGQTFRTRSIDDIARIGDRARTDLWQAYETGAIRLPIDARFSLDQVVQAFAMMKSNAHFGKIVVAQ